MVFIYSNNSKFNKNVGSWKENEVLGFFIFSYFYISFFTISTLFLPDNCSATFDLFVFVEIETLCDTVKTLGPPLE